MTLFNIYSKAECFVRKALPGMRSRFFSGRGWGFAFCSILYVTNVVAQPFSYIYIQGDKTTPFYVKTEGKMQPRYGKNHCIISSLTAGKTNIEILFQQNAFPAEQFTIDVPENGYKGYMLDKKENGFALYDLKTKTYLKPNTPATGR